MEEIEDIQGADVSAVYPKVAQAISEALGRDAADVKLDSRLIDDLKAESIDFLDIMFRLERSFQVKIPRGQIVQNARGDLSEAEFQDRGFVTATGLERLKRYLSEVPAERFSERLRAADIPLLFTVETFAKLVVRAQRHKAVQEAT